jgi:hypothetical protein
MEQRGRHWVPGGRIFFAVDPRGVVDNWPVGEGSRRIGEATSQPTGQMCRAKLPLI